MLRADRPAGRAAGSVGRGAGASTSSTTAPWRCSPRRGSSRRSTSREEPDTLRDAYGRTTYGQSCLLARRLVEAGVRFVTVYFSPIIGGKGTRRLGHARRQLQPSLKKRLLPITDQTLPTLLDDLDERGLLDETLVVWMGEFGRTPKRSTPAVAEAATTGRSATPPCWPAAASAAATSTAPATASAPTPPPTPSAPTTSPRRCSRPSASTPRPKSTTRSTAPCRSPREADHGDLLVDPPPPDNLRRSEVGWVSTQPTKLRSYANGVRPTPDGPTTRRSRADGGGVQVMRLSSSSYFVLIWRRRSSSSFWSLPSLTSRPSEALPAADGRRNRRTGPWLAVRGPRGPSAWRPKPGPWWPPRPSDLLAPWCRGDRRIVTGRPCRWPARPPVPTMPTSPVAGLRDMTISVAVTTGAMSMPVVPVAGLRDVAITGLGAMPGDPTVRSALAGSPTAAAFPPRSRGTLLVGLAPFLSADFSSEVLATSFFCDAARRAWNRPIISFLFSGSRRLHRSLISLIRSGSGRPQPGPIRPGPGRRGPSRPIPMLRDRGRRGPCPSPCVRGPGPMPMPIASGTTAPMPIRPGPGPPRPSLIALIRSGSGRRRPSFVASVAPGFSLPRRLAEPRGPVSSSSSSSLDASFLASWRRAIASRTSPRIFRSWSPGPSRHPGRRTSGRGRAGPSRPTPRGRLRIGIATCQTHSIRGNEWRTSDPTPRPEERRLPLWNSTPPAIVGNEGIRLSDSDPRTHAGDRR